MNWRQTQLKSKICDQDRIILDLYSGVTVRYIGEDKLFAKMLSVDPNSKHIVAIFNSYGWVSDLVNFVKELKYSDSFYLGVNRYLIKGNDTNIKFDSEIGSGKTIIQLVEKIILPEFTVCKSGFMDNDCGECFNFIQPLTWVYATNNSNK